MKKLLQMAILFLAITGLVALLSQYSDLTFGHGNFWEYRGYIGGMLFLVAISFFPRLTLFLSSVPFGGPLWWLGFIFAPRMLVAFLATLHYWEQNPILVAIAYLVAFGGEASEKFTIKRWHFKRPHNRKSPPQDNARSQDIFETEFREL